MQRLRAPGRPLAWRVVAALVALAIGVFAGESFFFWEGSPWAYEAAAVAPFEERLRSCAASSSAKLAAAAAVLGVCRWEDVRVIGSGRATVEEASPADRVCLATPGPVAAAIGRTFEVTTRDEGDDSVRDQRVRIELAPVAADGGAPLFRVVWAGTSQRCWPGRGHQRFSTEPCV